nr:reverse transcriptase domain-containing protein [Tanacetum cinerariifolium]
MNQSPVYGTDKEKDVVPTPKYDSDGDELVYEDEEVCLPDVDESLVIQRVVNVAPSKSFDDDSWRYNNIFCTKCTSKGKVCNMIINEGSYENVVSTYMVEKLALKTVDHPEPYQLTWLKKRNVVKSALVLEYLDFMPCGATTLTKHVVEVRHVIWMKKIQDVWRIGKILIYKIYWWMVNIFKWRCIVVED